MPDLALLDWLIFIATGATAGLAAGYLGIGGGIVIVPALSLYLQAKFPGFVAPTQVAVATSLASILATGTAAVITHSKHGFLSWLWVKIMAPGLILGAVIGVLIADYISSKLLLYIFLGFALISGLRMTLAANKTHGSREISKTTVGISGIFIGTLSSMLGIGGGTLTVPLLNAMKLPIQQVIAIASAAGVVLAVAGTTAFILAGLNTPDLPPGAFGYIYLPALVGIITASVLTAPLGARLVHKSRPEVVKRIFGLLLILIALRLFWQNL